MIFRPSPDVCSATGAVLLEVLLSVVILAVGLTVIVQAMMSALRAEAGAADYVQAAMVASQAWTGQRLTNGPVPREAQLDRFRYQITETENSGDDAGLALRPLTVTVSWPAGQGERHLSVAAYGPPGAPL